MRGLTDETIEKFRLGYAPEGWTGLVTAAQRVGVTGEQLVAAGLAKKRSDGSPYDVFRGRVMFPIQDGTGRVIAFGGRILVEKRDEAGNVVEAKYLNSPETPVFVKSEAVYGLNHAKAAIIKSRTVVVVEGYMDVIACHQTGVTNVVATLGTALTPEHARVLRRLCDTVVLVFDSDDAGHRAADRALATFVREPLDVKLASVPTGKDPCDFCMAQGGAAFQQIVDGAVDAMTYQWKRLAGQPRAKDTLSALQAARKELVGFVAAAMQGEAGGGGRGGWRMDPIRRGLLVTKLCDVLGISSGEVGAMLKQATQSSRGANTPVTVGDAASGVPASQSLVGGALCEAWVLGALLTDPTLYDRVREDVILDRFAAFRLLAERIFGYLEHFTGLADANLADFISQLAEPELVAQAIRVQSEVEVGGNVEKSLVDGWRWLADGPASGSRAGFLESIKSLREKGGENPTRVFVPQRRS